MISAPITHSEICNTDREQMFKLRILLRTENGDFHWYPTTAAHLLFLCRHKCHKGVNRFFLQSQIWENPTKKKSQHNDLFRLGTDSLFQWTCALGLIMIKTITEKLVDTVGCNTPSIHYINQANHFHFQQMKMNSLWLTCSIGCVC